MLPSRSLVMIGALVAAVIACVEVPQEVRQTFAPAGPGDTTYYGRRANAPQPDGFVPPPAPSASASGAPSSAPATAPATSTSTSTSNPPHDGGAP